MCGYLCVGFSDFMLKGKRLLEYINLISANKYEKNDTIILKYFQYNLNKLKQWQFIVMFAINIANLKKLKCHIFFKKTLRFSIAYSKCGHKYEKIFKESIEILKSFWFNH